MGMRLRIMGLVATMLAAAVLLTACPKPNGYRVVPAFPQLNFDKMLGLYPVPGDGSHALLLTQDGIVRYADLADPNVQPSVFLDVRDRMIQSPENEEGLLGLAFAPDYATSGRFYIYYTMGNPRRSTLSRFVAHGATADPASEQVLLSIPEPFSNHNGGALAFGPDGMLYVAVGDGGSGGDPMGNGQRLDTLHGKVLRLDVSGDAYTVPPDNPFVGRDARSEIYAYGLRNPWRLNFDRETGQLWAGDAGQDLWEEVDRVVPGGNYGWNVMEGAHCYLASGCEASGMLPPRAEYSHDFGCAVIGGFVYRGSAMPELRGWYVYGDFCSGRVWAVDASSDTGAAIPIADTNLPIASFAQDSAGELYVVTFANQIAELVRK